MRKLLTVLLTVFMLFSSIPMYAEDNIPLEGGSSTETTSETQTSDMSEDPEVLLEETPIPTNTPQPTIEVVEEIPSETAEPSEEIIVEEEKEPDEILEEVDEELTDELVEEDEKEEVEEDVSPFVGDLDFSSKRLTVISSSKDVIREKDSVIGEYNDLFLIEFKTFKDTIAAFEYYSLLSLFVEPEMDIMAAEDSEPAEEETNTEPETSKESDEPKTDEANPLDALNETPVEETVKRQFVIALLDSGSNGSGNVISTVSMFDDDGLDRHGHGSNSINTITQYNEDARILSIKVLDDNAKGTTTSVLAGIQYAIESNANVILLPLSGTFIGEQSVLAEKINEAIDSGITVIGAAGNNNNDAKYYIPGNIENAIIVGSVNEDGSKTFRSNFGSTVDFSVVAGSTSEATAIVGGLFSKSLELGEHPLNANRDYLFYSDEKLTGYVPSLTDGLLEGADVNQIIPITDDMMVKDKKLVIGPHNQYTNANMWLYDGNGSTLFSGKMVKYTQVNGNLIDNSTDTFRFWMPQVGRFGDDAIGAEVVYRRLSAEPSGSVFKIRLQPTFDGTRRLAAADVIAFGGFNVMLENSNKTEVTITFYKDVNVSQSTPNGTPVNLDGDQQRVFMVGARGLSNETRSVNTVEWSAPFNSSEDVYTDIKEIPREWWASRNFLGIDVYYSGNEAVTSKGFGINNADYYYDITDGINNKFYLGFIGSGNPGPDFTQGDPTMWFRIDFKEFIKVQKKIFTDIGGKEYQDYWEMNEPTDLVTYSIFAEAPRMQNSTYDNWSIYDTLDQFLYIDDVTSDVKVLDKETKEDKTSLFNVNYDTSINKLTVSAVPEYLTHSSYGFYDRIYEVRIVANRIQYEDMTPEQLEIWKRDYSDYQIANKAYFTYKIITPNGPTEQFLKETDEVIAEWPHGLRIKYLEYGTEAVLWAPYKDNTLKGGDEYSVESPDIRGYEFVDPERKIVEGTMPTDIHIEKVYYKKTKIEGSYLTVTKSSEPESNVFVAPGETITYTLRADNSGIANTDEFYIEDPIPVGTTYVAGSASDGGVYEDGKIVWRNLNALSPRGSKEVSFQVVVNEGFDSVVYNSADYKENKDDKLRETNLTVHPIQNSVPGPASLKAIKTAATIVYTPTQGASELWGAHSGSTKTFVAPYDGIYHFEIRGAASCGRSSWSADAKDYSGGVVSGDIQLTQGQTIYAILGETGSAGDRGTTRSFNGGGKNDSGSRPAGGGAAHIAITNRGELKNYKNYQNEVIAVAGGAGYGYVGNCSGCQYTSDFGEGADNHGGGGWYGGKNDGAWGYGGQNHINNTFVTNGVSKSGTSTTTAHTGIQLAYAKFSWNIDVPNANFDGPGDIPLTVNNKAEIEYSVTIANDGVTTAKDVVITDIVPDGTDFLRAEDGGVYNQDKNRVEWVIGDLPTGASKTVKYTVNVNGEKAIVENQAKFDRNIKPEDLPNADPLHDTNIVEHIIVDKITIEKEWSDDNNSPEIRPQSITVHFSDSEDLNETYELNEDNNWKVNISGLTIDPSITYTVWEEPVFGYQSNATEENPITLNINRPVVTLKNDINKYKVTTEVINGTIDPAVYDIIPGKDTTINYSPNENYILDYIEVDGVVVDADGIEDKYAFTNIQADHHIKVVYYAPQAPVKAVKNANGVDIHNKYVDYNSNLYYEITVKNTATSTKEFVVTDNIPNGTEFVSVDDGGVHANGKVTWTVNMEPNEEKVLKFVVKVKDGKVAQIDNYATQNVEGHTVNTNTVTNYTAYALEGESQLKQVFNAQGEDINTNYVNKGDNLYYTITIDNNSSETKTFVVTDKLPENTQFISANLDGKFENGVITWEKEVGSGKKEEFKFVVKTTADGSIIPNKAKITVDELINRETNEVINYTPAKPIKSVADNEDNDINGMMMLASDELTYYIRVKNVALIEKSVTVTDTLPEHLELISVDNDGKFENGVITWELSLEASQEALLSFKAKILETGKGKVIENQAEAVFEGTDPIPSDKTTTPVMPDPIKTVTLDGIDVNGQTVDVGTKLLYTIYFENVGEGEKEFTIVDTLPNNTRFVEVKDGGTYDASTKVFTWTKTLSAKEEGHVSFVVETTRYGSYIPNVATVSVDAKSINTNKVDNTTPSPIVKGDLVSVYKDSNPISGTVVEPGDIIEYTLTAVNTGDTISGITTITDPLASEITYVEGSASDGGTYEDGMLTWTIEGLHPQESKTVSFKAVVNDVEDVLIRNYANYSTTTDKNPGIKTTNEVIHPVDDKEMVPALDAHKTVAPIGMVRKGDLLLYTITLTNNGGLSKDNVITDIIPEGTELVEVLDDGNYNYAKDRVEWYLGDVDTYEFREVSFVVRVLIKEGIVYNQANFGSDIPEDVISNSNPPHSTNITENPVEPYEAHGDLVTVHKESDPISGSRVEPGQIITYKLIAANFGVEESGLTTIKDTIPEHTTYIEGSATAGGGLVDNQLVWTVSNIAPQDSKEVEFKVKVNEDANNVIIRNHATYISDNDVTPGEKTTNETVHGTGDAPIPPVLEMTKYNSPTGFIVNGGELTYTLVIKNNGGSVSKDTVITDEIPEYTELIEIGQNGDYNTERNRIEWYIGDLEAGEEYIVEYVVKVNVPAGSSFIAIYNQAQFDNNVPKEDLPNKDLTNTSNIVENVSTILSFLKTDTITDLPVKGAKYAIFRLLPGTTENDLKDKAVKDLIKAEKIEVVTEFITTDSKNGQDVDINGTKIVSLLNPSVTYYLQEVEAPFGYQLDPLAHKFRVQTAGGENTVVKFQDAPKPLYVRIAKADADKVSYYLKGAEITIFKEDGSIAKTKDGKNAVGVTDANGIVTFILNFDQNTKYYARETKAPAGYSINTNKFEIVINDKYTFFETDLIKVSILDKIIFIPPIRTGTGMTVLFAGCSAITALALLLLLLNKKGKQKSGN